MLVSASPGWFGLFMIESVSYPAKKIQLKPACPGFILGLCRLVPVSAGPVCFMLVSTGPGWFNLV